MSPFSYGYDDTSTMNTWGVYASTNTTASGWMQAAWWNQPVARIVEQAESLVDRAIAHRARQAERRQAAARLRLAVLPAATLPHGHWATRLPRPTVSTGALLTRQAARRPRRRFASRQRRVLAYSA